MWVTHYNVPLNSFRHLESLHAKSSRCSSLRHTIIHMDACPLHCRARCITEAKTFSARYQPSERSYTYMCMWSLHQSITACALGCTGQGIVLQGPSSLCVTTLQSGSIASSLFSSSTPPAQVSMFSGSAS